jgi:hypothetical protein
VPWKRVHGFALVLEDGREGQTLLACNCIRTARPQLADARIAVLSSAVDRFASSAYSWSR